MKKLIFSLLALVLLTLIGAAVFALTFDADRYKSQIEVAASDALEMPVLIRGKLSLAVADWKPALSARDVMIGKEGKDAITTIEKLDITFPHLRDITQTPPWKVYLQAENVFVDGTNVGSYESPVRITADGFTADDIKGRYKGGTVTGTFTMAGDRIDAELQAQGMDYEDLNPSLTGGELTAHLKAKTHGSGMKKMTEALQGRLIVSGTEGKMDGNGVNFWGGELLMAFLKSGTEKTKVNCLVADFNIVDGVMITESTVLDTDAVAIFGKGNVNLVREDVTMRFSPKPKGRAILNVSTDMLMKGPFTNIKVEPDPKGMVSTVGKLLLGAVNPAMIVVPYVFQDTASKNTCVEYLSIKQ